MCMWWLVRVRICGGWFEIGCDHPAVSYSIMCGVGRVLYQYYHGRMWWDVWCIIIVLCVVCLDCVFYRSYVVCVYFIGRE